MMFDVKHRFGDQTRLLLICLAPSKAEAEQCREWQHRMPPIRVETLVTGDCQDYEIPSTNVPIAVLGVGAACREAVKYARSLATSGHDVADIVFVNPLPQELEPVGTPFECRVECFTTATISESDLQPLTTGPCSIHPLSAHAVPQPPPASKPMANGVASGGALRPSANGVANGVAHGAPNGAANGAAHGLLFEGNDRDDPLGEQVLRALCHHHLELPLQHLVLHQACLTPDATAVVYEDERLSYAEFCSVAWDLAGRIGQSVPPTAHISVCVPKCAWLPVTWMAACLCRCPFFSLDLRVPVPTIEYQVDLWEPLLIVCWDPQDIAHLRPQLPRLDLQALLPQLQRTTPPRTIQRAAPSGLLEDVIAIEWTSGTTGKPKGVEVAQRGLVHWVFWRWWQYPLSESDPYVSAMNLFYFWYWALPLCQGGAVVLVPDVMNYSVQKVALYLQRHNVTRLESVTPSLLRVWLEVATDADLAALARLKITNVSSEPTSLELCKLFFHKLPRCRLVNILACTETSSDVAFCEMSPDVIADAQQAGLTYAPIGKPIWNVDVKLAPLDPELGYDAESGELWVAGPNIHHGGYYKRPDLSAKFDAWPSGETVYKSGDVATRINSDGRRLLAIIGRADHCVKVRGFRIELNAVEETLKQCDKVMDAALVVRGDELWAVVVYVPPASGAAVDEHQLTAYLLAHAKRLLPAHHLPDKVIPQATLPYTINGKLDRKTILQTLDTPQPDTTATSAEVPPPASPAPAGTPEAAQQRVVQAWQAVLHGTDVPRDVSFFEAGGQSLTAIKLAAHLDIDIMDIFAHPTVEALAEFIHRREHPEITAGVAAGGSRFGLQDGDWEVAVVGMAGRWPGAQDYDVFWANIVSGAESVTTFTHREMQEAGVPPELLKHPHWVPKGAVLDPAVVEAFDLQFWGLPKQEAVTMDCNHRILLEIAYEALEDAGYNPFACPGAVGVYACGPSLPHYLLDVWPEDVRTLRLTDPARYMELEVGSDKDYISTRVSYLLNLTGPSKTIQTACSSSLVCVAEAVQQLRMGDCTMALAGGVSVFPPQCTGYLFQEGMIWAPDARCRPFDAAAKGTHNSNAGAVVVLKGCRAAEADGDCVRAVVQGVAVNNDGRTKVGYLAPSVRGQSAVYGKALADAGVGADAIGYVECHGTGTVLGDPLELTALGQAYQRHTAETQYCAIGSVKANIGHANTAAGICGFVKAVLCAARATLPPLAHFVHPNPKLDLARSPFWVPTACQPWTHSTRVAAATSLGMGGTNAHVLLRSVEPHTPEPPGTPSVAGGWHLLALSAHTPAALQNASTRLAARLAGETAPDALARAERTLLLRRPHIAKCRRAVVCRTLAGGAAALVAAAQAPPPPPPAPSGRPVVLLFPGQGSQYPGMGAGLYAHWPRYRAAMDACSRLAGRDCQALDPNTTLGAQLAIFATSYALATALTEGYGIAPVALVGHSVGQYVAACVGGALSLGDAVAVLLARGAAMELMAGDAATAMVAVQAAADALQPLPDGLALACVNAPARCVVAGPAPALQAWQRAQEARGVACRPLPTAAAFHSAAVTPEVMARFKAGVAGYAFAAPRVPVACNVTGGYLSATQPTDAGYWARHMRSTVRFEDNVRAVLRDHPTAALVEVGPGQSLTALARLCVAAQPRPASPPQAPVVVPTTRHPKTSAEDAEVLLTAVGRLWEAGVSLDWAGGLGPSRALPLPTYPFDRVRCWPDPKGRAPREPKAVHAGPGRAASPAAAKPPVAVVPPAVNYDTPQSTADLLYCVQWHPQAMVPAPPTPALQAPRVPVCLDGGDRSVLARLGLRHVPVAPGPELLAAAQMHRRLLWVCAAAAGDVEDEHEADRQLDATGRFLTAVQELLTQRIRCQVVLVVRERAVRHAGLLGLARSLALEHPELGLRRIVWDGVAGLAAEVAADHAEPEVWVRGDGRAVPRFVRYALPACAPGAARPLRAEACYLVTGGLRGIGLLVAEWLARRKGARHLVLVGRAPPAAPVAAHLAALAAATGCAITPAQCDVADAAAVAALLAGLARPLRGVVHCAGTVDDGAALKCTPDRLARVVRPKAAAWHLHRLTAAQPLDFMVLFSSSAGVWGTAGQASYAAGNTCLDCLAAHRARQGLPTVAVQWGGWEAVGMSVDLGLTATNGEEYLTPAQGLAVLDQLLQRVVASPDPVAGADAGAAAAAATTAPAVPPQLTVINVADWAKFRADAQLFGSAHPPLLASLDPAELAAPGAPRPVHPLLGAPEGSPGRGWAQAYVLPPYVREHQYRGSPLVPATCYLEMACAAALQLRPRAAAGQPVVLRDVEFVAPLALADLAHRVLATVVEPPSKPGVTEELRLRIMSRLQTAAAGEAGAHTVHATCRIGGPTGGPQAPKAPRDATDTEAWEPDALYAAFAAAGFGYGPSFRLVTRATAKAQSADCTVALPVALAAEGAAQYCALHPAAWDACTHAASLVPGGAGLGGVPARIGIVVVHNAGIGCAWTTCAVSAQLAAAGGVHLNIVAETATTPSGEAAGVARPHTLDIEMRDFFMHTSREPVVDPVHCYGVSWAPLPPKAPAPAPAPATPQHWVVAAAGAQHSAPEAALRLQSALQAHGDRTVTLTDLHGCAAAGAGPRPCSGIVVFAPSDAESDPQPVADALLEVMDRARPSACGRVWLVAPFGGAVWGLGRHVQRALPGLLLTLVCLAGTELPAELLWDAATPAEVRVDASGGVLVPRARPLAAASGRPADEVEERVVDGDAAYVVSLDPKSGIDGAGLRLCSRDPPKENQVEIRTQYWALNFRDVLVALGVIPMDVAGQSLGIGGECVGTVTAVGAGVNHVAVGDTVVALPPDGLGRYVVTDAAFVFRKPPNLDSRDAVGITLAYATAWLALKHLGRVAAGDRVLVHSAAGGVGLAAVQIAHHFGAEVYATCSTAEKRQCLTDLGVKHVSDSRCAHFDAVMDATGGEGVDIVLNSLAGKQMLRSLQLLRPFGRFIEIGKRDQYDHTPVDLHPFLEGLTYATAHLDVLMLRRPAQARALMLEVWKEVELGHLAPLPSKVFPIGQLRDSLQYFSQGVHIGKILIEMDVPEVTVQQPKSARSGAFGPLPEPDDGWCIVAGVGPAAAAWLDRLAAGGARNLLCIGAAAGALADCRAHTVSPADLVAHGPAFWSRARPPIDATARLQGIVHVAADAAPSPESCRDALALAQALHALAAAAPPLEFFVTVAPADGGVLPGPVGAAPPRPTAWPAAAFGARLRQLDRARRARGVPSVCVQVHAGGGGVVDLSPAEIVQECAAAWPQVAAADAAALEDGLLLSKRGPKELAAALGPCYAAPFEAADGDGEAQGVSSAVIREWLAAYVAAEFGLAAADVDLHRRLEDYGFDSLALINLSRRLVKVVGSEVTALDMYDHPSIAALAERFGAPATAPAASPAAPPSSSGPVPVTPAPAPSTVSGLVTAGRRRVLCLHGFRTNRDIMKLQCRGLVQHFEADVEFAFLDAPHPASGPGEPEIERQGLPVREWYGEWNGDAAANSYLEGWRGPRYDGFWSSIEYVERYLSAEGPFDGILGFSQGGAIASAILARQRPHAVGASLAAPPPRLQLRFAMLLSSVDCKAAAPELFVEPLGIPSLHVFDASEEHAAHCWALHEVFGDGHVLKHAAGHSIPASPGWWAPAADWLRSACAVAS